MIQYSFLDMGDDELLAQSDNDVFINNTALSLSIDAGTSSVGLYILQVVTIKPIIQVIKCNVMCVE